MAVNLTNPLGATGGNTNLFNSAKSGGNLNLTGAASGAELMFPQITGRIEIL